jgi:hypothetical protein
MEDSVECKSIRGRVVISGVVVVCLFCSAAFGQGAGGGDGLLRAMPGETLFAVRVNKFDWTVGQLDQFLAGASPVPLGVSMMARMQIAGSLGDPELKNVDTNGSFAIFGLVEGESGEELEGLFMSRMRTEFRG